MLKVHGDCCSCSVREGKAENWSCTGNGNPVLPNACLFPQDTVVALEALALYATKTFIKDGPDLQVSLSAEGFNQNIRVDKTNRLLLQTVELPAVPRDYIVRVQGHGCLFLQVSPAREKRSVWGKALTARGPLTLLLLQH